MVFESFLLAVPFEGPPARGVLAHDAAARPAYSLAPRFCGGANRPAGKNRYFKLCCWQLMAEGCALEGWHINCWSI